MTVQVGGIVSLALVALVVAACGSVSAEPRLVFTSVPPTETECRHELLGPVTIRVDPAEPGGALIVTDEEGTVLDPVWDPRCRVEVAGDEVLIEGPDGRTVTSPMMLVGSRLSTTGFLVCDLRAAP